MEMRDKTTERTGAVVEIRVNEQVRLTEFRPSDKPALVEHLREKEIYDRTLRIPFPYTEADAEEWFGIVARTTQQQGQVVNFAIRNSDEFPIGGCGFDGLQVGKSHRAEIGYWLAKPYWNRGIMSAVVEKLCRHGFEELKLVKLTAHVFAANPASARVLGKCGFVQEGYLKKHYFKDGQYLDARLFALLK
jgi:RimJ/RimL family protein N-acetyltransferase